MKGFLKTTKVIFSIIGVRVLMLYPQEVKPGSAGVLLIVPD